jgi:hypothetical protein
MLRSHRGRADDHLGAVRLEHVPLVLADLVGADEDALVALGLGHHRETHTGVAGGRLHDGATGLELTGGLGRLDHPGRDPVLHGAPGVEVLHLREHHRPGRCRVGALLRAGRRVVKRRRESEERGVADEVEE